MTRREEFYFCGPGDDKATVYNHMDEEKYDQAPFRVSPDETRIKGYVLRESLKTELSSTKPLTNMYVPIEYPRLISHSTPVVTALKKIIESRFLYVLKHNEICGLVTYADFDKRPVRLLLYALFAEMESNLIQAMRKAQNDNYWLDKLNHGQKGQIERYYEDRKLADTNLSRVECFGLPQVFQAIKSEAEWRKILGLERTDYDSFTEHLVRLRNEVSHQGLDIALTPNDLEDLLQTKDELIKLLRKSKDLRDTV